jgi:hypothetical protein
VGRRVRLVGPAPDAPPGPWLEIIGVAPDLGVVGNDGIGLYRPLAAGTANVHVAVRLRNAPVSFVDRFRAITLRVDPTIRMYDLMGLDRVGAGQWLESQYLSRLLAVLSGLTLLLSLLAVYAVVSFTVTRRTREIATRVALGGDGRRIMISLLRRPLTQIGIGIGAGEALAALTFVAIFDSTPTANETALLTGYVVLMLGVCFSACMVPMQRALRLQPGEVLRSDGG